MKLYPYLRPKLLIIKTKFIMKAVKNIDWELFNKQRHILADLLDGGMFLDDEEHQDAVEGIVNLLDAMSDEKYYSDKAKEITKKF